MRLANLAILFFIALTGCYSSTPPAAMPNRLAGTGSLTTSAGTGEAGTAESDGSAGMDAARQGDRTGTSPAETENMTEKVVRTEEQWRELLTPEQYYVLREKGTERPFINKYDHHFEPGVYACAACGAELFSSETKFNSGCGWPAFYAAKAGDRVVLTPDDSLGMIRTEVTCARCGSHLGHIFDDAPQTPTGQRYCINSVSLKFIPAGEAGEE